MSKIKFNPKLKFNPGLTFLNNRALSPEFLTFGDIFDRGGKFLKSPLSQA